MVFVLSRHTISAREACKGVVALEQALDPSTRGYIKRSQLASCHDNKLHLLDLILILPDRPPSLLLLSLRHPRPLAAVRLRALSARLVPIQPARRARAPGLARRPVRRDARRSVQGVRIGRRGSGAVRALLRWGGCAGVGVCVGVRGGVRLRLRLRKLDPDWVAAFRRAARLPVVAQLRRRRSSVLAKLASRRRVRPASVLRSARPGVRQSLERDVLLVRAGRSAGLGGVRRRPPRDGGLQLLRGGALENGRVASAAGGGRGLRERSRRRTD